MEKIIFEDLPSTNTPLNAENLNKIQENVENNINEINNKFKYSTEEQIIGTWFGKPLYRKVINTTLPSVEAEWTLISNDVPTDIETVTSVQGILNATGNGFFAFPMGEGDYYVNLRVNLGTVYCTRKGWGAYSCAIIIEYTKATD